MNAQDKSKQKRNKNRLSDKPKTNRKNGPNIEPGKISIFGARQVETKPPETNATKPSTNVQLLRPSQPIARNTESSDNNKSEVTMLRKQADNTKTENESLRVIQLINNQGILVVDQLKKEIRPSNPNFKVVTVIGGAKTGKRSIIKALFNEDFVESPYVWGHCTTFQGERTFVFDTSPIGYTEEESFQLPISAILMQQVKMLVFLILISDTVIVMEVTFNFQIRQLLKHAYMLASGIGGGKHILADAILVRNKMDPLALDTLSTLEKIQSEWIENFKDVAGGASIKPRFAFAGISNMSNKRELSFLKRILYFVYIIPENNTERGFQFLGCLLKKLHDTQPNVFDLKPEKYHSEIEFSDRVKQIWSCTIPDSWYYREFEKVLKETVGI